MKKRNNLFPKIMAGLALGSIIIGILWTGILFLFTATTSAPTQEALTQEELEQMIQQFSGSLDVESLSVTGTTTTESQ